MRRNSALPARLLATAVLTGLIAAAAAKEAPKNDGLLFYLSADNSLNADLAKGEAQPNFLANAKVVKNGRKGGALQAEDDNVLSWLAPGNITAARGTLAFFWRARKALGEAPFVIFRVGYADHSSWDMAFLRVDYNGHGFDAFVTDNGLARSRVSFEMKDLPPADAWTHIAFSWDENSGVRLYIDGKLVAEKRLKAVYDAGLDQFGMAARVVSPHQVQSRYNFMRGSDYDELRIYDHALKPDEIADLADGEAPDVTAYPAGDLSDPAQRAEWNLRYGFGAAAPVELSAPVTAIRKVEFADARDIKQFMWKGTDGIAETTWPGVYNRSRLPGRDDYFQLPDWNVYVEGGKTLTLTLPPEPWNHVEIRGTAYGALGYAPDKNAKETRIAERAQGIARDFHQFAQVRSGGILRFTNIAQETPIQEIAAYHIAPGRVPEGKVRQTYFVRAGAKADSPDLDELNAFIKGRYAPDARATVVALPVPAPSRDKTEEGGRALPLVHILIPYEYGASPPAQPLYRAWGYGWENMYDGLDGIALAIPALNVKPDANGTIPLNIQIKDPLWPERNMLDVTVAMKPNQARTLWLDVRDRILPDKSFYLTIAAADQSFDAKALDGAKIELVFKDRKEAIKEHLADRLMQVRDNWGFLVEEHTASKREALYRRIVADIGDLLRIDPDNKIGREYWTDITYRSQGRIAYTQPVPPKGVPLWAFRQLEDLKNVRHFVNWWIDNRQSEFGDLGGGLSDDTDLTQQWPGLAMMGVDPGKIRASLTKVADAVYKNGMFTDGLSTIVTDELHAYEEGINSNSEMMYLNYGSPKAIERLFTTIAAYDRVITVNPQGRLLFNSNWYGGAKAYRDESFQWGKYYSYLVLHPAILMGWYNNDPISKKFVIGLCDSILAFGKKDKDGGWLFPDEINWRTGETRGSLRAGQPPMQLFWAAWRWTGDEKYLRPILSTIERSGAGFEITSGGARMPVSKINLKGLASLNENLLDILGKRDAWGKEALKRTAKGGGDGIDRYLAWQASGDKTHLEALYAEEMHEAATTMYSQTDGEWWSDRVGLDSSMLQRSRLGGIGLWRNNMYPGATVSWKFANDEDAVKVAILMPNATPDRFKVIAFNTAKKPVTAAMTGWSVTAGEWEMKYGGGNAADEILGKPAIKRLNFERSAAIDLTFAPGRATVYEFALVQAGEPVDRRPDIGIDAEDVKVTDGAIEVTVHSLGAVDAPPAQATLVDAKGKWVSKADLPALKAPKDLKPHTATVRLPLPAGFKTEGAKVVIGIDGVKEITQMNNSVDLP